MYKSYFFLEGPAHAEAFKLRGDQAKQAIAGKIPGLKGYIQTRTLAEQVSDDTDVPFVGIAELEFAQREDVQDTVGQAAALLSMLAPQIRVGPIVTGHARTVTRLPEHHTGQFIKGVFPFRRMASMPVEDFQRYWWRQHGAIAAQTQDAVYYLQCHPLIQTYEQGRPPYDGITELHWPTVEVARRAMASRQMREDQSNDAKSFLEPDSVVLFLASEEAVLRG